MKSKGLEIVGNGRQLLYTYDSYGTQTGIASLLQDLKKAKIDFKDLNTTQSSLEEIFVQLVSK
ncbi:hypothetical protein LEP1GSC170_0027 [Leptospira interrogans serovar Bataviae str. HAI135]|nr:hypothetical protein LEP1GSC170_0027 [Leptospira interrogans serovar Bataviae str. HAI135]